MSKRLWAITGTALILTLAFVALFTARAEAHEHREVGPYEIVFGWQVEPAFAGVFNGPELTITDAETGDPVEGAEETLRLRVRFGPANKVLTLSPAWGEPGHYVAPLTPTRAGDYAFELTGKIGATTIRETFTSADGEFSSIEPVSDHLFPDSEADLTSLQRQIDALTEQVEALQEAVEALEAGE